MAKDMKSIGETHHGADGKFTTPKAAHTVSKHGERYMVVRQHRRMVPLRHSPDQWARFGDHLYRKSDFVAKDGAIPFGGERYVRIQPSSVRRALRSFAPLMQQDSRSILQSILLNTRTPFVMRVERKDSIDPEMWGNVVRLLSAAGYTLVADVFGDSPVFGGKTAADMAVSSGGTYLMRRG